MELYDIGPAYVPKKARWRGADWEQEKISWPWLIAGTVAFLSLAFVSAWILP